MKAWSTKRRHGNDLYYFFFFCFAFFCNFFFFKSCNHLALALVSWEKYKEISLVTWTSFICFLLEISLKCLSVVCKVKWEKQGNNPYPFGLFSNSMFGYLPFWTGFWIKGITANAIHEVGVERVAKIKSWRNLWDQTRVFRYIVFDFYHICLSKHV